MTAALLGAASCRRCGATRSDGRSCLSCRAPWVPADEAAVIHGDGGGLGGVVRAGIAQRVVAGVIDLVVVALPITAALLVVRSVGLPDTGSNTGSNTGSDIGSDVDVLLLVLGLLVAVLIVVAELTMLLVRGRTPGRLLLSLRTVDDLSGTPVRPARLLRQFARSGFLTADLHRGRDPLEPRIAPAALGPVRVSADARPGQGGAIGGGTITGLPVAGVGAGLEPDATALAAGRREPAGARPGSAIAGAHRSAGIVLDSGERYEVDRPLLIGRSPVDPDGRSDRVLLSWADLSRKLAKTHVLVERSGSALSVTDLHSASGTALIGLDGSRSLLGPGEPTIAPIGALIQCGGRTIKVVPGA